MKFFADNADYYQALRKSMEDYNRMQKIENPINSFDARVWAKSFVEHVKQNPAIATDEGAMVAWFASALMRGYDEYASRAKAELKET